jgi:altronate hydrolase
MTQLERSTQHGLRTVAVKRDTSPPYVRLGEQDNVVVLARHVDAGDSFAGPSGEIWTMSAHLDVGNKLAAVAIAAGDRVFKVGVPIGTATRAIRAGEHVHSHNLQSDHIPIELKEEDDKHPDVG